jgi:hypothetical protein
MANQIVVSAGAKVRNLSGVLTATSGVVSFLPIDVSLGIPQLDVNGKILVSQLPNSVMEYKGTWDISTNTPTLVNGTGNQGDVYLVEGAAVGGTSFNFGAGGILFFNGDQAIYSGSIWQRGSGATGSVTSISITESGDSLNITGSPITTSGTINIGFNGTNLQYVNGAGNLTTFPILTGYVPYTGATANVDLGAFDLTADLITGATGSFASSGGSDTFAINHSSGGGIALNITKGGNGEGLYINKTSGSGNAATIVGTLEATTLVKSGGTSSQFLKADGTVDSNTYALDSLVVHLAGTETITGIKNFNLGLTLQDGYYPTPATGYVGLGSNGSGITILTKSGITVYNNNLQFPNASNDYNFPNATGTIALTSDLSAYVTLAGTETITGAKTFSATSLTLAPTSGGGTLNLKQDAFLGATNGYTSLTSSGSDFAIIAATGVGTSKQAVFSLASLGATLRTYTLPDANGILALTSDIPSLTGYVTLATTQTITGIKTFSSFDTLFSQGFFSDYAIKIKKDGFISLLNGYVSIGEISGTGTSKIVFGDGNSAFSNSLLFNTSSDKIYTFPNASGTIALTSDIPSLTGYVPYTGATGAVNLGAYDLTVNGIKVGIGGGSGANNTRLGSDTLSSLTTASNNVAIGANALFSATSGNANAGIGANALYAITTGTINTAIGFSAGSSITTGSYNTIVGKYVGTATLDSNVVLADGIGNLRFVGFSTGNVYLGAGTTLPTDSGYKLDVNGTGRFGGNTSSSPLELANTTISNYIWMNSATGYEAMSRYSNPTAGNWYTGIRASAGLGTTASYHIYSSTYGGDVFVLNTDGTSKFAGAATFSSNLVAINGNGLTEFKINNNTSEWELYMPSGGTDLRLYRGSDKVTFLANGNVGIGTSSPSGPLTVQANTGNTAIRLIGTSNASSNNAGIFWFDSNDSTFNGYLGNYSGSFDIYNHRSTPMVLYTGGTARLTIASTGVASFSNSLTTSDLSATILSPSLGTNQTVFLELGKNIADTYNSGEMSFKFVASGSSSNMVSLGFYGAGNKLNVLGNGNVGIGTVSPNARLSLGTGTTSKLLVYDGGFTGSGGNGFFAGFAVDYPSGNDFGMFAHNNGALVFGKYTNNNDLNNVTERMRITSGGVVFIGASSIANSGFLLNVLGNPTSTIPLARYFVNGANTLSIPAIRFDKFDNDNTTSQVFIDFTINNQNTASGSITANGASQATFTSWSDERLKENITNLPSQLSNILALRPVEFDYKDGSGHQIGFIAQEVQEIYPDIVGKNAEGYLTISGLGKMESRLIKAIQEQQKQIEELKLKIQ